MGVGEYDGLVEPLDESPVGAAWLALAVASAISAAAAARIAPAATRRIHVFVLLLLIWILLSALIFRFPPDYSGDVPTVPQQLGDVCQPTGRRTG
jgi:CHASE2 domain-containing sensor protein